MAQSFDLIVIGTGVAASIIAGRCRKAGWSVAIVDERPFGGTCVLRGCDPKKMLRRGAEIVDAARLFEGKGTAGELRIDWPQLMAFKRSFTDPVPPAREKSFAEQGIAAFHGRARFIGPTALAVGEEELNGRRIAIASGAIPRPLSFPGTKHITISDDFLELDELPGSILFIGGGYISFEFAHIAARAGARVVVLDRGPRPLGTFDPDLVARLLDRTRRLGIDFHPDAAVESVERTATGLRVEASIDGRRQSFEADLVVHGAGRIAALAALEPDRAGVKWGEKGVEVNEFLQSVSNPAVYAAGDSAATAGPPLTPIASLEGGVVAANLLDGNGTTADYTGVPSVVFTIPALASVGLLETAAKARGIDVAARLVDMSGWYTVRRVGETHAAAKVLIERGSQRIVGAHVLSPDAVEIVDIFALAIRNGLGADRLGDLLTAYPSAASDIPSLL